MKNFNDLKQEEVFEQMPVAKFKYWTKVRCTLLTKVFYILNDDELRAQFDGYSMGSIRNKASELRLAGWDFIQAKPQVLFPKVGPGSLWLKKDEDFMMLNVHLPRAHLAELMNRTVGAITARINLVRGRVADEALRKANEAKALIEYENDIELLF
jgi:hypothetical protein